MPNTKVILENCRRQYNMLAPHMKQRKTARALLAAVCVAEQQSSMDETKAREILGDWINSHDDLDVNSNLDSALTHIHWTNSCTEIIIDADLSLEQLEAIAWWVNNKRSVQSL